MGLSKRALAACGAALGCLLLFSACNNLFTTSLASWLTRSKDYSSLSLDELLKLASTRTDSDSAKAILDALAGYSESELKKLSTTEKEAVLEAAINATFGMDSVLDLVDSIASGDDDDILANVFALCDNSINMDAVNIILQDETALKEADIDTLLLASVALVTSVSDSEDDIENIFAALKSDNTSDLDEDLIDTADALLVVLGALQEREDEVAALGDSLGLDLTDILPGFSGGSANP